jgi:hypothetical protein
VSSLFPHAVVFARTDLEGVPGASGAPLRAIEHDGLAMLGEPAHATPSAEQPQAFMDAVSDLASLTSGACVPMRAVAKPLPERDARAFLRAGRERLARLLERLRDKEEWAVRLTAPANDHKAAPRSGPGSAYLDRRRRDLARADGTPEPLLGAAVDAQRSLAPLAAATRAYPAPTGVSIAVLVEAKRSDDLERLAQSRGWTLAGPYPAFSFVSLTN